MNTDNSTVPAPETESQRLFFAIWPLPELAAELCCVAGRILEGEDRRVSPENIHLTLVFLGAVDGLFQQCAERVAAAVRVKSFTLTLEQITCWPKQGILWAGPNQAPAALLQLVSSLKDGLVTCGYVAEERPFAAHLTLARKVRQRYENIPIEPIAWEVRRFCLVRSVTRAEGAVYQIVRSWELD
jgi:2'-5' RNA ligase